MRIVVRKTNAHNYTAIDEDMPFDMTSPMGLGNSEDEAREDLLREIEKRRCDAFDCAWPQCECGERGK